MDASKWLEAYDEKAPIGSPYLERIAGVNVRTLTHDEAQVAYRQEAKSTQAHTHSRQCPCGAWISDYNTTGRCSACQREHVLRERRKDANKRS